jgi:hypothetical protein
VTLETYSVTSCAQMASGPAVFASMKLVLEGNTYVAPKWTADTGASECDGKLTITDPYYVTIQHN